MLDALAPLALRAELARWADAGHRPALWWRDDDARRPSAALDRLRDLSAAVDWPILLAIVPDDDVAALAAHIAASPMLVPAQHGAAHANHAAPGLPPAEIPAGMPEDAAIARLQPGHARLEAAGLAPFAFVPPWNRIDPPVPRAVAALGHRRISGFGDAAAIDGALTRLDAHVDVLRWGGGARFRGAGRVLDRLRRLLAARRAAGAWREPIGLLTHHLDHDPATWDFLPRLIERVRRGCDLLSPQEAFARVATAA